MDLLRFYYTPNSRTLEDGGDLTLTMILASNDFVGTKSDIATKEMLINGCSSPKPGNTHLNTSLGQN